MTDESNKHRDKKQSEQNEKDNLKEPDDIAIPDELRPIIEDPDIPDQKKSLIIKAVRKESSFRGPIPPPDILKGYNEVVKDGAERILLMAEKQLNHRIAMEDHSIKEEL